MQAEESHLDTSRAELPGGETETKLHPRDSFLGTLYATLAMIVVCIAGIAVKVFLWG